MTVQERIITPLKLVELNVDSEAGMIVSGNVCAGKKVKPDANPELCSRHLRGSQEHMKPFSDSINLFRMGILKNQ